MDIQRRGPVPILFPSDGVCEKKGTEDLPTFEREVGGDGKITCSKWLFGVNSAATAKRVTAGEIIWLTRRGLNMLCVEKTQVPARPSEKSLRGRDAPLGPHSHLLGARVETVSLEKTTVWVFFFPFVS